MKRAWMYLLAGSMVLSLAACGTKQESTPESGEPAPTEETVQNQPESATESILFGNDTLGWLDLGAYKGIVKGGTNESSLMQVIAVGKEGGLIQAETLTFSNEPDFDYACDYLRSLYSHDSFTGKDYENKDEREITLDGMPALRVYGEREDTRNEGRILSCAGYITQNAAGDYIIYKLTAPKDLKDENGDVYRPTIEDLCSIVETTFRRSE